MYNNIVKFSVYILWRGIIVLLLLTYAGESPFWETRNYLSEAIGIAPQGWAFFTRDPREPQEKVYFKENGSWVLDQRFYAGSRPLSKLYERNRLVHVELANILQQVEDDMWRECQDGLAACISDTNIPVVAVRNISNLQILCGQFLIESQPPVPWAWASSKKSVYMPSKLVQLEVECDGNTMVHDKS